MAAVEPRARTVTVGVGALAETARRLAAEGAAGPGGRAGSGLGVDLVLSLGPGHPSSHGMLRLRLELEGATVRSADPLIGHLHRGAEKLFEVRDYRQILVLANRHDWLAAFGGELAMAMTVESMLGIEPPPRATWLRTLYAELGRILAHVTFLGAFPMSDGAPLADCRAEREGLHALLEIATGARIHLMTTQVGGLKQDVDEAWLAQAQDALTALGPRLRSLQDVVEHSPQVAARARGVGALTAADAAAYGVSGPAARAGGLDLDLRRDEPYLAYGELFAPGGPGRVVTRQAGDTQARLAVLAEQALVSVELARECLRRLARLPGPVSVRLPKTLRAPEGSGYVAVENPAGLGGYYLVSRGGRTPWRVKLRSASFNNLAALPAVLPGARLGDVTAILASLFFVIGDVDK